MCRDNYWGTFKATIYAKFERYIEKIKKLNGKTWENLHKILLESWTKATYNFHLKNDTSVNNMCEKFNSKIIEYMAKPIITMVKERRCYKM